MEVFQIILRKSIIEPINLNQQQSYLYNSRLEFFFANFKILGMQSWRKKHKLRQIFNCNIVIKYFASCTGYEDDIFEVISNLDVQESKFGEKKI